ncbi:hypothetical protein CPHO_07935 [Corynebacterium phocae]|uniref:DUF402 domain-containing protein n=1 Tax=Corynebacterium phocae TaxID=161895 RepID=A0A1L7D3Z0_9CORY|nr:DUF402 domain-containing protein [Corynebacterium phocae]APT92830.1 hypothetical protein CPHO_07935 [Corynebacterium phocae]KAA8723145.1 DUF402 domain-containing protein [Corynebacterium phocae]
MHAPKVETFSVPRGINVDPKGYERPVETFRETDFGLYMARGATHPRFGYLESWLLPTLGLRVNKFHVRSGDNEYQDFYIDVVQISAQDGLWETRDLYVDLLSTTGRPVDVEDTDELSKAATEGLLEAEFVEYAIDATLRAVEGITRHDDNVMAWLDSLGMALEWAESVNFSPEGI